MRHASLWYYVFTGGICFLCLFITPGSLLATQELAKPLPVDATMAAQDFEKAGAAQLKKIPIHLQLPEPLQQALPDSPQRIAAPQSGLVTTMAENFEGTFPGPLWSFNTGNYTWAKRNCAAYGGSYSAWAVGGGTSGSALSCGTNYPNDANTIMIYGPFDLSDANWAAFSFLVWLNSESNYDYFSFMASGDGSTFNGYSLSGTSNDTWIPFSQSLTAVPTAQNTFENHTGKSAVWIAFAFSSNASSNLAGGAYVDDIVLQKGMVNVPTVVSSFASPGPSPRGLTVDGSTLWCSDATNDLIYKLTTAGSVLSSFASPSSSPTGLAWDATNLWNADFGTDRIYKLSTTGTVLSSFSAPGTSAAGLTWDGSALWNSDVDAPTIWKLNTSGAILSSFSAPGTFHYGLTWDGQNLWLADAETMLIYKMDTAGMVLDYFMVPGSNPTGLAWDGANLWAADRNTDMIYKLEVTAPQQFTNDVGITGITLPNSVKPGESVTVAVTVKNLGTASQNNFPVNYSINNGAAVTENFTGTLAAGASATMTFGSPWVPSAEGTYRFTAWTALTGDENPANDNLPAPQDVVVSTQELSVIFTEDFENYPVGVLGDAPGTPWVRFSASRNGNVTTTWVHGGQKNFQTNSFTTSTEIDYVKFNLSEKPSQLNVELWYTPDGFYVYKDFAEVGLGYSTSKFNLDMKAGFAGSDHNVIFNADGMSSPVTVFNELEYGSGPAPSGTPKHNYMRAEFDFSNGQVKFFIGTNASAPLRSTVNFDGTLEVNALYIAGGLNPTFIDDIKVEAKTGGAQPFAHDVGVTEMELPEVAAIGSSIAVKAVIKNYGTASHSNFPVSYRINNGIPVTENFSSTLNTGATATHTFAVSWSPTTAGTYQFTAWTALSADQNSGNDSLAVPKQVVVSSQQDSVIFTENFESYPVGVLADAPGSPWVRLSASRVGEVTTTWVHGGQKNFQINSFTTSTEIDYVNLNLNSKPDLLKVELWYTPDGFFVYKDFAEAGLGYATAKYTMDMRAGFAGSDHNVVFIADGMNAPVTVFSELEYGSGPAPSGTPKHNYMRAEFDFVNGQVKFFIGADSNAPLRSTVSFDGSLDVNALYFAGGLNPTYIDDIRVTIGKTQRFANDVGVTTLDMPDAVTVGNAVPVKAVIKNFGTASQSTFPVKYSINNGPAVTENFSGSLAAGATATHTFSALWTPTTLGTYRFTAWTALAGDENSANDALPTPKDVVVQSSNHTPVLSSIGNQTITAGQIKNVQLTATDADGDPLTISIPTNPGFLSISGFSQTGTTATATLIIAPSLQLSGSFNASVQVSDGTDTDSENFTIQVNAPQANPLNAYRVEPVLKAMEALTGTTTQIFGPNTYGQLSPAIDLPFSFTYAGASYNQVKVSSTGFLTFNVTETYYYPTNNLGATTPKNAVAPLWDNLNTRNGRVHYQTLGSAPNRKFIVEFYQVVWGPFSSPVVDFQIVLVEGSNDIEFHYGTMANAGFGADGASIGIKDDKGNFINALDGSRDLAQNAIVKPPKTNFRFTTSPAPAKDVGVSGILVTSNWFVGSPDTVKVILENRGSEQQTGFTVVYQPEGKTPVREIFASTLLPQTKALMTFSTTWEPQAGGLYSIQAWTELAGDANALNDSVLVEDAMIVYELERPRPINVQGTMDAQHRPVISWSAGQFQKPLPGVWNGKTSENQNVHMIVNFNSTHVDSCEIYYKVQGDPFPFPLETYSRVQITNNQFSIYYSDQYGRMSTDVKGTFLPPDSCYGTWKAGVYVNNVYTVFSGTWTASAEFATPQLRGFQVYRALQPGVQPMPGNWLADLNNPSTTSYVDNQVSSGIQYHYCVVAQYDRGASSPSAEVSVLVTGIADHSAALPTDFALYPAYPNPFNPQTTIHYDLPKPAHVQLRVYNVLGEVVATLVDAPHEAGNHTIHWDGVDMHSNPVASGIYLYRLQAGAFLQVKKMSLLR